MKALPGGILFALVCAPPLAGQETDRSLERIALELQQPRPILRGVDPVETPVSRTFGIFTMVPPELPGEMIRVSVPIGELVSRAFRGVAAAKQQRQEERARRRVAAALQWFSAQQPCHNGEFGRTDELADQRAASASRLASTPTPRRGSPRSSTEALERPLPPTSVRVDGRRGRK